MRPRKVLPPPPQDMQPIWQTYLAIFSELWDLDGDLVADAANLAVPIYNAEFELNPDMVPKVSILPAIRNALYGCVVAPQRRLKLPPSGRIVDFGAGVGVQSALLAKAGRTVLAIEPPSPQYEVLKEAGKRLGFETATSYTPQSGDIVLAINVLEHLYNPLTYLQSWLDAGAIVRANVEVGPPEGDHVAKSEDLWACGALLLLCGGLLP